MEENAPNVNVVVTQQPGFKKIIKIVLILACLSILVFGLIILYKKTALFDFAKKELLRSKTAQNANNQLKDTAVATSAGGSGGSATVSAQTPVNVEASSALEAKIVDISVDAISFETINQELLILPTSKITDGSYMVLNTPVKLILTKSTKDGSLIKAEVTKLNPK